MAPICNTHRALLGRDADSGCEGWSCYNGSQQIGIVFMAIVVPVVVGLVFWFGLIKPNLSYWKRVSSEAKQRQEMEQQVREDALRQLPLSPPPDGPSPGPPQERKPQEQPQKTQDDLSPTDAPPREPSPPVKSQQAPVGSPLKLPPAFEAPRGYSPVAEDDVPFINSPKSIQPQSPRIGSVEEARSPVAEVQPSDQKTQAETRFQWGENIPEMQRPHLSANIPMMPFPPFQQQQKQQYWQQHQDCPGSTLKRPFPRPSFHPFISVLPPPPPPPIFAPAGQQVPGSYPAQQDQPVYHPPPQPTYAPSSSVAMDKEQQSETPSSLTTKSTSFPKFLFSRPRETVLPPRSFTESDLGSERKPFGNRGEMAVSPMALPSETSSGNNRREGRDTEDEREEKNRHDDARHREGRYARSEHSFESQSSRDGHARRYSSSRRRHGARRHSPHSTRKHERRRARRESSRSCSPDYHRLQERPKSTKRSRLAFLAPLIPIALGALGIATEARAQEQRKRVREAEEFSIRHRSLERGPVGRRSDDRARNERRRSMSRGHLEKAIRVSDGHAADSALNISRDTTQHQQDRPPRIRYTDLQTLRGGSMSLNIHSEDGRSGDRGRREKTKTKEDDRSSNNSGNTMSSTYWRFRDSDSLRRNGGSDSSLGKRP